MDTTQPPGSVPEDVAVEVERLSQVVDAGDPVEAVEAAEQLARILSEELDRKVDSASGD